MALALALAALAATLVAGVAGADPIAFTVTTTENSGDGSLRQAITDANSNANPASVDTIDFAIPAATDSGCDAASGVCTISPSAALPEVTEAVEIDGYSQPGASPNTLSTGSDADLKVVLSGENAGSKAVGIKITGSNSVIKGLIINRWQRHGVELKGSGATGNKIEGNFVGTDASGTGDLGNFSIGVLIDQAPDNVVGGTSAAARNIISGNRFGAFVFSASGNEFKGNYIGTDRNGTADLGNSTLGVQINNAPDNVVGGTEDGAGNLISGNNQGILVSGPDASGNSIEGNLIGTDVSGARDLGNSQGGVLIQDGPDNVVGGNSAAAGNTISGNGENGIAVIGDTATGNGILRNSISGNEELGIVLSGGTDNASGVTENDPQDPDTGPNNLQNYPTITSVTSAANSAGKTVIPGTLNSTPNSTFEIQLFLSPTADASGFGEGEAYLGETSVSTDANGDVTFRYTTATPLTEGEVVSATATDTATGDTSEFSGAVAVESDTVAPETAVYFGPESPGNDTTPTFKFSGSDDKSSSDDLLYSYRVDGGAWSPFSPESSVTLGGEGGLTEGAHTFDVRALDEAGNEDQSPDRIFFVVDISGPETTIDTGPSGPTNDTTPTFGYSGSDTVSQTRSLRYSYRVDGGTWSSLSSGTNVTLGGTGGLSEGAHTFDVRAVDRAGNEDQSPAQRSFVVDISGPETEVDTGPSGPTNDATPTFGLSGSDNASPVANLLYSYRVDNGTWSSPSSETSVTLGGTGGLAEGAYTFEVKALDQAGNEDQSPAQRSFSVDITAPNTAISDGPSGNVTSASASFDLFASEGGSTYECSLDGAAFSSCQSPRTYSGLADGPHTFSVRATDQAGNTDQTPARRSFAVDTLAPTITSVTPPAAKTSVSRTTNVTATFSEAMRGASLRATGTFTLTPPPGTTGAAKPPVAATVGYHAASKKLTLNPTNGLARNTTYTAKVTTAAKDSAGNRLAADKVWRFTTIK